MLIQAFKHSYCVMKTKFTRALQNSVTICIPGLTQIKVVVWGPYLLRGGLP
jgi:hypothetical protein